MTEPKHRADIHPAIVGVAKARATARLANDARNRSKRTFLTGLAIDVSVGIALVLGTYFASADSWGSIQWIVLSFSIAKSAVQATCAFVLRRFLDPSGFPTPLPPSDPGEPDAEAA